MKKIFLLAAALILSSCATIPEYGFQNSPLPQGTYTSALDKWTSEAKAYKGVISTFQVTATLNAPEVLEHQIYIAAVKSHRTQEQYQEAWNASKAESQKQTTFFVALYADKDDNNDLDQTKSLWNIFLDAGGKRISPKSIKRVYENRDALLERYPYLNPWSRPYLVTFPVRAEDLVNAAPVTLTLAGPVGAAYLKFPN